MQITNFIIFFSNYKIDCQVTDKSVFFCERVFLSSRTLSRPLFSRLSENHSLQFHVSFTVYRYFSKKNVKTQNWGFIFSRSSMLFREVVSNY